MNVTAVNDAPVLTAGATLAYTEQAAATVIDSTVTLTDVDDTQMVGATVELMATEIRHLQRTEVGEAEEPFRAGQKGSSAMPHKRNPVTAERLAGLARVLRGNLSAGLEDVALWHERDISHSSVERIVLPDSSVLASVSKLTSTPWE